MTRKKKVKKKKIIGPVLVICILTFLAMILSTIFSVWNIEIQKASIVNGTLEMSLVSIRNMFSKEGIQYLIGNSITNFRLLEPLALLILSFIASSILESSGILKHFAEPMKKWKPNMATFIVILVGIAFTFFGDYSYIILLPIVGILYQYIGRNPIMGIVTVFLGITLGHGAGLLFNYNTYLLGISTQLAATVEVDHNYVFNVWSHLYIMLASTGIISFLMTMIIEKFLSPKFPKPLLIDEDGTQCSKKAMIITQIVFIVLVLGVIYLCIPGFPGSGILLDSSQEHYIAQLFSDTAPFKEGFVYLFALIMMVCGAVYGFFSKNITSIVQYNVGLSRSFHNIGYVFVLMFFSSAFISVLNWTNLGQAFAAKMISFMSNLPISGLPLIVIFFVIMIIIGIVVPNTLTKWQLASPIMVPLFMRANLTPDFTQFIFTVADGIGKCLSPVFIYFIIMLGFMQKYNYQNDYKITIFGTLRLILPVVLLMAGIWLFIILAWYIVGFPLGIGTYPTL